MPARFAVSAMSRADVTFGRRSPDRPGRAASVFRSVSAHGVARAFTRTCTGVGWYGSESRSAVAARA
ncbi:hypothetical protein GCM10020295_62690 [Streptomyces cinereospinus]